MRARRIPLSYGAHVTGWHPVRLGHGMVSFESALERDCIGFLTRHSGFLRIRIQPTTISFVHAGHARRYTPDFLADFECVPEILATLRFAGPGHHHRTRQTRAPSIEVDPLATTCLWGEPPPPDDEMPRERRVQPAALVPAQAQAASSS